jgi:hypothetical protein
VSVSLVLISSTMLEPATRLPVTGAPPWTGTAFIAAAGLLLAGVLLHLAARETESSQKSTVQNSTEGTMTTQRWPLSLHHLGQRHARGR